MSNPTMVARSDAQELAVSLFVPPHNPAAELLGSAATEIRERSQGRLLLRIYPSEQLGTTSAQFELARTGKADLAYLMHGTNPGVFPLTELATLPFVVRDPVSGTSGLIRAMSPFLEREHSGVKLLFVTANAPMAIHSVNPFRCLDDFKGRRIRHAGRAVAATLHALGSLPVDVMPLQVKGALARGEIDAAAMTHEGALVNRLAEIAPHIFELNANTVTFALVMNERRYQTLSSDLRDIIDDVLGPRAGMQLARMLAASAEEGRHYARDAGTVITQPSDTDRKAFDAIVGPLIDATLTELAQRGLPAQQVFDRLVAAQRDHLRVRQSPFEGH
jgi:TRAP-type C4-dicarboxylate transport system substrate-binding protein